ncbi:hypothetical protein J5Y03_01785 [Bacillus sp. RG28]|uniref:Uncharacterized protein n=1 Tax=Gottfriedia endophytica TaxID=2820819 RepID=A0A940NS63_9BACI|nr:hypothetical protein [Gottfriedia endophytica]MBP0723913.1 hypothetical protein [Gottfriedia endophytica]
MDDNLVFFPNLKDRIIMLGKKALEEKNFKQALLYCDQLKELNQHTSQTELAAVACLMEQARLKEAKQRCEELVFGAFESDEAIDIYISLLVQLYDFNAVQSTIKDLMKENRISKSQMEQYESMLSLSSKVAKNEQDQSDEKVIMSLFDSSSSYSDQLMALSELRKIESANYIPILKKFYLDEKANPIIKSLVCFVLQEQQLNTQFIVKKLGMEITWNPIEELKEHDEFVNSVVKKLTSVLENEDPSLLEIVLMFWQHFITIYFPLLPSPHKVNEWAATMYVIVHENFDRFIDVNEVENQFSVNFNEIEPLVSQVRDFEKQGLFDAYTLT